MVPKSLQLETVSSCGNPENQPLKQNQICVLWYHSKDMM